MGADYYETPADIAALDAGTPPIGFGAGSVVERAIVDKNCRAGEGVRIVNEAGHENFGEGRSCVIRDGIVVVPKNSTLPAGWKL